VFETKAGTWQEVFIPFSEMVPLFRGFIVDEAGTLAPATIRSFGMMVTDKQEGNFSLEVDWINAVALDDKELTYASARAEN
jgi:monofunctional biosynthetic peptidoglycan transglycosylase